MIQPIKIQVRFTDLDVYGHVNNNIYFSYFEMARVHYFRELLGDAWNWMENGFVLAKNEVDYVKSILLQHEPKIEMYTESIGTKSFVLGYELKVNDVLFAKGKSVQVCFNAKKNESVEITEEMKKALTSLLRE